MRGRIGGSPLAASEPTDFSTDSNDLLRVYSYCSSKPLPVSPLPFSPLCGRRVVSLSTVGSVATEAATEVSSSSSLDACEAQSNSDGKCHPAPASLKVY
jgi:hypothetical protein